MLNKLKQKAYSLNPWPLVGLVVVFFWPALVWLASKAG